MSPIQKARAVSEAQITLGVSVDASEREIHNAWKRLAFELHPDRGGNDGGALAKVNAAYSLLKKRGMQCVANSNTASNPGPQSRTRPIRPRSVIQSMPIKVSKIDPETRTACIELVKNEPAGHGHVADEIERVGRKVTFIVHSELAEGVNRVAVPIPDFGDGRKPTQTSVAFRSSKAGPGTLDLPASIKDKVFPGTTSVRFRFSA